MRRREPSPAERAAEARRHRLTVAVVVGLSGAVLARGAIGASPPQDTLVEVIGDVPRPGVHALDTPDVAAAVIAAGGPVLVDPRPVADGDRIEVRAGAARVRPSPRAALFGRPVDVDTADAEALASLPGIGPATAAAIVAHREARGPFGELAALAEVPGVGPSTIARLGALATTSAPPRPAASEVPTPLDPNTASVEALATWSGVGPALAARIVEGRPYGDCAELDRVKGIGPAVLARITPVCAVPP